MSKYTYFFEIPVWKLTHDLALEIYQNSKKFPKEELYGLTSQLRRSAWSVPTNIAEGSDHPSNKVKKNFLLIAKSSLIETQNHLLFCKDLGYITSDKFNYYFQEYQSAVKQIGGWIKSL